MYAPYLPFDGMNEQGVAVGMAAVPPGDMPYDPQKKTINELGIIREILDHADTVEDAIKIMSSYYIDMEYAPLHYLVASASGEAALVEFYQGEMHVFCNTYPWLFATNFLVSSTAGHPEGQCSRFDRISQTLQENTGQLTAREALNLLADVSQYHPQNGSGTQWSIVYDMSKGEVNIVMGRKYEAEVQKLKLLQAEK